MRVLMLDNDGVICLPNNWGSRFKKQRKVYTKENPRPLNSEIPVELRFDNFDKKAIKILNEILEKTSAEIVVSSDWRFHANLEELGNYYLSQGIIKKPIGVTPKSLNSNLPFYHRNTELEETRAYEIKDWLKEHPEVTNWVAIDDLDMSERFGDITGNYRWGLKNFVHTHRYYEGIKQCGVKEKILKFLNYLP